MSETGQPENLKHVDRSLTPYQRANSSFTQRLKKFQEDHAIFYFMVLAVAWVFGYIGLSGTLPLFQRGWVIIFWGVSFLIFISVFIAAWRNQPKKKFAFWYPWLMAFALAVTFLIYPFINPYKFMIPPQNPSYDSEFKNDTSIQIAYDGRSAFKAGDYAYAIMFFKQCEANAGTNVYDSWQANSPLLAASLFHQYPTSKGYEDFTNSLNIFVSQIEEQLGNKSGWFYKDDDGQLRDAEDQLKTVATLLPTPEEKDYVEMLVGRIDAFKATHPPMK